MTHYDWNQMEPVQVSPQISRKAIHSGNMTVARLELQMGAVVPEHSHYHEQITIVERGAVQFAIEGGQKVVRAGESLVIPPNVPHGVTVLEDTVVFDVFAPSREDWPR